MGFIEFGVFVLVVLGVAAVINWVLPQMNAPAIAGRIIWGIALLVIVVVFVRATIGDVAIPRLR